jgi:hypothetical protein
MYVNEPKFNIFISPPPVRFAEKNPSRAGVDVIDQRASRLLTRLGREFTWRKSAMAERWLLKPRFPPRTILTKSLLKLSAS